MNGENACYNKLFITKEILNNTNTNYFSSVSKLNENKSKYKRIQTCYTNKYNITFINKQSSDLLVH